MNVDKLIICWIMYLSGSCFCT